MEQEVIRSYTQYKFKLSQADMDKIIEDHIRKENPSLPLLTPRIHVMTPRDFYYGKSDHHWAEVVFTSG